MFYNWIWWQWDATKGQPENYTPQLWYELSKFSRNGYHNYHQGRSEGRPIFDTKTYTYLCQKFLILPL
jgi:hypothetical protein